MKNATAASPVSITQNLLSTGYPLEGDEKEQVMGCRGAGHAGLKFTNVELGPEYLLGEVGQGMEVAIHSLSVSRVHIATSNLGMAQRMLEISLKRAADRVTFGKPIIKRQAIKMKIANMQMMIHALRTMVYDFARDFDFDPFNDYIDEKAALLKMLRAKRLVRCF